MSRTFRTKVPEDFSPSVRVDKYLSHLTLSPSRSAIKSALVSLTVNGRDEKLSYKVKGGDEIALEWEERIPERIEPEDIPLDIIYEDENVCVVNKAQGMVVHPAAGVSSGTLVNALLFHFRRPGVALEGESPRGIGSAFRAGIVHRLDKDTSGVIITAKNAETQEALEAQFRARSGLVKEYIAICRGRPPARLGVIETRIARDERDRKRFTALPMSSEKGRTAITYYKCVSCYGEYSLMKFRLKTGRTHQIRVHAKYINCPVLGDAIYSKPDKKFPKVTLMLNARMLVIRIPEKGRCVFKSPTPERFLRVMKALKRTYKKTLL